MSVYICICHKFTPQISSKFSPSYFSTIADVHRYIIGGSTTTMGIYRYVWVFMGMYKYIWVCMGFYGYLWVSMAIFVYVLVLIDMYGYV